MTIQLSACNILHQLEKSIANLTDEQYSRKTDSLSGNSIGQHTRHAIEFFTCLNKGFFNGIVNYENRNRDIMIENSVKPAIEQLNQIKSELNKPDKELILEFSPAETDNNTIRVKTSYFREIAYNMEHIIHHMAMLRNAFKEVAAINLSDEYGVAASTLKYRKEKSETP